MARLSTLSVGFLAVLMVSYVPVLFPGLPGAGGLVFTGLTERMLIAVDMFLIATMAVSPLTPGATRHREVFADHRDPRSVRRRGV